MRVNHVPVTAGEGHQSLASLPGEPYGECGRRGQGDEKCYSHRSALLHHLEACPAGDQHVTGAEVRSGTHQSADGLVQSIVAPDIFAYELDSLAGDDPRGGVNTPRARVDGLLGTQLPDGLMQLAYRDLRARSNLGQLPNGVLRSFGAAQAAARAALKLSPAL